MRYSLVYFNGGYAIIVHNGHHIHRLTKTMNTPFSTDKEKFVKFLELLPEVAFSHFVLHELPNSFYIPSHFKMVQEEQYISRQNLSVFKNAKINKKYVTLNKTLYSLLFCVSEHFYTKEPRDKYNSVTLASKKFLTKSDTEKLRVELHSLCINAKEAYDDFVKSTHNILSVEIPRIENVSGASTEPIRAEAGLLNLRMSGTICYEDKIIEMRPGLKPLSEVFIERPNQLINRDDIADALGTNMRTKNKKSTIAKYVSELNKVLEPYFGKQPIVSQKTDGWIFTP